MALGFLLYVAPVRQRAGVVIWLAACAVAFLLLVAIYFFQVRAFAASIRHAHFWGFAGQAFVTIGIYKQVARQMASACPAFLILFPVTLPTYFLWPRTRYFVIIAASLKK